MLEPCLLKDTVVWFNLVMYAIKHVCTGFLIFFIDLSIDQPTEDPNGFLRQRPLASPVVLVGEDNCLLCIGTLPVMTGTHLTHGILLCPSSGVPQVCVYSALSTANWSPPWCHALGRCHPRIQRPKLNGRTTSVSECADLQAQNSRSTIS